MASIEKHLEKKVTEKGVDEAVGGAKAAIKGAFKVATDESHKMVVRLTNKTNQKWSKPKLYLNNGATDGILPLTIDKGEEIQYEVHKKKWTYSGIAGVIVYQWKESEDSYYLAVMFEKPMVARNMWNAVIFNTSTEANQQLFDKLNDKTSSYPPMRGDSNYIEREFSHCPYTLQGAMSTTGRMVNITICYKSK